MNALLSRAQIAEAALHAMPPTSLRRWLFAAGWTLRLLPAIIVALTANAIRSLTSERPPPRRGDDMPQITIMDGTGDSTVRFDPDDADSLAHAAATFDSLIDGTGRRAFAAGESGAPGRPLDTFDPTVDEIVVVAPFVGG